MIKVAILAVKHWQERGEILSTIWHGEATRGITSGDAFWIDLPKDIIVLLQEADVDKALRVQVSID